LRISQLFRLELGHTSCVCCAHCLLAQYLQNRAAVSPWQFKNIDGSGDWVELSDTLWNYRWQQAVNDVKPDIVEIGILTSIFEILKLTTFTRSVTWNDYGESHYISDINPNVNLGSQAPFYVDGFVHSNWRDVARYYISYFKKGTAPTITVCNS
jgi:glucan endo-1,3-alpha-glucosidase